MRWGKRSAEPREAGGEVKEGSIGHVSCPKASTFCRHGGRLGWGSRLQDGHHHKRPAPMNGFSQNACIVRWQNQALRKSLRVAMHHPSITHLTQKPLPCST